MTTEKTKVIFRQFKTGEIIALFPALPGTNDPNTCESYMHVGQHSSADTDLVQSTKPAKKEKYQSLKRELESIGYKLEAKKRFSRKDREIRIKEINR